MRLLSAKDFHAVLELLGEDSDSLSSVAGSSVTGGTLAELEERYERDRLELDDIGTE